MMKKYIPAIVIGVLVSFVLAIVYNAGKAQGMRETIDYLAPGINEICRIMHELHARSFPETEDVPDPNVDWHQLALSWRTTAEHYGGICRWLLENEPIYGTIVMDANTTLSNCLIVAGSSEAAVEVNGASGFIYNNMFMAMDMDWILSRTPVDPNEYYTTDCNLEGPQP